MDYRVTLEEIETACDVSLITRDKLRWQTCLGKILDKCPRMKKEGR